MKSYHYSLPFFKEFLPVSALKVLPDQHDWLQNQKQPDGIYFQDDEPYKSIQQDWKMSTSSKTALILIPYWTTEYKQTKPCSLHMITSCLVPDDTGSEQRLHHYNYPAVTNVLRTWKYLLENINGSIK